MTEPLTNEEYVATYGTVCPYCRSEEIEGGSIDVDGGVASQEMWCLACSKQWFDKYDLVSYLEAL